jgi:hypothetical protein
LGEEITEAYFDGQFGYTPLNKEPPLISANVQQTSFHPISQQIFSKPKRRWVPWLLIPMTIGMAWYGMSGISSLEKTPAVETTAQDNKVSFQRTTKFTQSLESSPSPAASSTTQDGNARIIHQFKR